MQSMSGRKQQIEFIKKLTGQATYDNYSVGDLTPEEIFKRGVCLDKVVGGRTISFFGDTTISVVETSTGRIGRVHNSGHPSFHEEVDNKKANILRVLLDTYCK